MKIYIQSKSGDFNAVTDFPHVSKLSGHAELFTILSGLRQLGGYLVNKRDNVIMVPIEEVEYIREAKENE